jgi:hypothetical protein
MTSSSEMNSLSQKLVDWYATRKYSPERRFAPAAPSRAYPMRVVIRFGRGTKLRPRPAEERDTGEPRRAALAISALLTPATVAAAVLGLWRIAADLEWAGDFAISTGLFSHWQVWIAAAAGLQVCARLLNRYGRGGGASTGAGAGA